MESDGQNCISEISLRKLFATFKERQNNDELHSAFKERTEVVKQTKKERELDIVTSKPKKGIHFQ